MKENVNGKLSSLNVEFKNNMVNDHLLFYRLHNNKIYANINVKKKPFKLQINAITKYLHFLKLF